MIAFIFPGQGSQQRGMGRHLFDEVPEFTSIEEDINALLGYSVRELCLHDGDKRLTQIQFAQPCLYLVNALHYYRARAQGLRPSYLAGHSLGEFNALHAAGVFDLLTGLSLVMKRGELMARAADGAMLAISGLREDLIVPILMEHCLVDLDVANFNSPQEVVISGPPTDIDAAAALFERAGASLVVRLPVATACHSRYMVFAARAFQELLSSMTFCVPRVPVISNVTALPYPTDRPPQALKSLLVDQMVFAVQWTECMRYLMARGVTEFQELGPGRTLTCLMQQFRPGAQNPAGLAAHAVTS